MHVKLILLLTLPLLLLIPTGVAMGLVTSDRIEVLEEYHGYFPCNDCHTDQETIPRPRIMVEEHFEPLEWEDDDGVTHLVPFGEYVAIADLLGLNDRTDLWAENMVRIGARLQIESFMTENDFAPEDSVWTLVHGGGNLWCLDCHNAEDRNHLVKLSGELLTFNQSQLLCGECHGPILLDWERGIHGKTTGYWDTSQDVEEVSIKRLCVECHLPHAPAFRSQFPLPGPVLRLDPPGHGGRSDSEDSGSHDGGSGEREH